MGLMFRKKPGVSSSQQGVGWGRGERGVYGRRAGSAGSDKLMRLDPYYINYASNF